MRSKLIAYAMVCAAAAMSPLVAAGARSTHVEFPGWPTHFDGRPLTRLPDTAQEAAFFAGRAVRHARFSDGERVVLMSWADQDIAGFHLARECFRAFGFALDQEVTRVGPAGRSERCVRARRGGLVQRVCEHIRDGTGRSFDNEPAWHIARVLGASKPPYWGVSVVEIEREP